MAKVIEGARRRESPSPILEREAAVKQPACWGIRLRSGAWLMNAGLVVWYPSAFVAQAHVDSWTLFQDDLVVGATVEMFGAAREPADGGA